MPRRGWRMADGGWQMADGGWRMAKAAQPPTAETDGMVMVNHIVRCVCRSQLPLRSMTGAPKWSLMHHSDPPARYFARRLSNATFVPSNTLSRFGFVGECSILPASYCTSLPADLSMRA